jgi:BirA family transcriptional regulator, biotin operon repressor / biotin---[acetyl-CoA-carboxylase] ligase
MPMTFGADDYERALRARGLSELTLLHRRSTGSTSDDARKFVASRPSQAAGAAAIVIAETQTSGRGRGVNRWSSPEGSIAFTLTAPGVPVSRLSVLPLGVGACVALAIRNLGGSAAVKWPNDVLVDGLKVCGILCESSLLGSLARVFIGIGINVEAGGVEEDAAPRATTLARHGLSVHRPTLVADITARVLALIKDEPPNAEVVDLWKGLSAPWWGEQVDLIDGENKRRVTLLDVNPEGQLVVRDETGVVRSLVSGEVQKLRAVPA